MPRIHNWEEWDDVEDKAQNEISKLEKELKNFIADSLTSELQAKLLKVCSHFDDNKEKSGYIKDNEF